jgi:hypothetical protein
MSLFTVLYNLSEIFVYFQQCTDTNMSLLIDLDSAIDLADEEKASEESDTKLNI